MGIGEDDILPILKPHYDARFLAKKDGLALVLSEGCISEMPEHVAATKAFYIDKTEVTNGQYAQFVKAAKHRAPPHWKEGAPAAQDADKPVTHVSYNDAAAYAKWAAKRLPTEMEWEKAARGVDARLYPWGFAFDRNSCHHMRDTKAGPTIVGSYPAGASPYGCLDMLGNVLEWTSSWFQPYKGGLGTDRRAPYGMTHRVLRGGAWYQHGLKPIFVRCSSRFPAQPDAMKADIGFRCVKDVE